MRVRQLVPIFVLSILLLPLASGGVMRDTTLMPPPWNHCLGIRKVTQFHLDLYSGYSAEFDDPQGLFCIKLDSKDDPETDRDDDELTVFGLNSGAHQLIYNKGLTSIGIVGRGGSGPMEFSNPISITGDTAGNIYVADAGNDRILHLRYLENDELVQVGEMKGEEDDLLANPTGVSLSGGRLYVADSGNDRIVVFDQKGDLIERLAPRTVTARLVRPLTVAAVTEGEDWLYYSDHFIAVVDSLGKRLWKLTPEGKVQGVAIYPNREGGFGHIAIDYYGNIYVTDPVHGCIHKFNRHLDYIMAFGGEETGRFDEPRGITIYRRFGQIFVSERAGAPYYWIGTDIIRYTARNLTLDLSRRIIGVDVSFLLTEHSFVSLHLEDEKGRELVRILGDYLLPAGTFERRLELPYSDLEPLANCKLRLVIVAKPSCSSRAYHAVTEKSRPLEAELTHDPN